MNYLACVERLGDALIRFADFCQRETFLQPKTCPEVVTGRSYPDRRSFCHDIMTDVIQYDRQETKDIHQTGQ